MSNMEAKRAIPKKCGENSSACAGGLLEEENQGHCWSWSVAWVYADNPKV